MPGRADERAFTLVEMVAVLIVVSIAASLVLARVPHAGALELHAAGARLAERLSEARERAILGGSPVRVDLAAAIPAGVSLETLDVGGARRDPPVLDLDPGGDALPARATLADADGARLEVVLPPGFQHARSRAEAP